MLASKAACTGCSACAQACPRGAISMELDPDGFPAPRIQDEACIRCWRCERVCPILQDTPRPEGFPAKGYACSLKDADQICNSTSGGLFYALAEEVLECGGVVFGAALTRDLSVEHEAAANEEGLAGLRKSKYVQSHLRETYAQARCLLSSPAPVLFSGTPCQIAGLCSYLGESHENLLAVEVFCGQVTGYLSWTRYLEHLQRRRGARPLWFGFREKACGEAGGAQNNLGLVRGGWKDPYTKAVYGGGACEVRRWREDEWTIAYVNNMMQRPSCDQCKFKQQSGFNRADIAIGDFWGVESNAPAAFERSGTSAALVYTEKGERWLDRVRKQVNLSEVDIDAIRRGNPAAWVSARAHPSRGAFFGLLRKERADFALALQECLGGIKLSGKREKTRFGVWGGFSLREAVLCACETCRGELGFHISNINLISQAATPLACPERPCLPANPVRSDMLELDFGKAAFTKATEGRMGNADFIVVDFMEERFPALRWRNSYITGSDALKASALEISAPPLPEGGELTELWKESCLRFISLLGRYYSERQIILVRSLLCCKYEPEPGRLQDFGDGDMQRLISEANSVLDQKYDFFLRHCRTKNIITPDASQLYCEHGHKHGVAPSHYNRHCTVEISKLLCEIATKETV